MRLTLRTLLAWRDGLLQGTERDDLAAKVAASTVAPRLIEQIAALPSRADLAAPEPLVRDLVNDANTVAEFLDNTLPAEHLEAFERACLESEIQFAEVADCHERLAETIRNAHAVVALDAECVERLLGVIVQSGTLPHQTRGEASNSFHSLVQEADARSPHPVSIRVKSQPQASIGAWLSAGAAIVLLLVLCGLLVRSLGLPSSRRGDVAAADRGAEAKPVLVVPRSVAPIPAREDDLANAVSDPVETQPEVPRAAVPPDSVTSEPDSPDPRSLATSSPFPLPEDGPAVPPPVTESREEATPTPVVESAPTAPVAPPPQQVGAVRLVDGGPIVYHASLGDETPWLGSPVGSSLPEVTEFIVPAHCYPLIVRENVSIRLFPATRGALTADRDGTLRLEIVFGRATVWSEEPNARCGITAGGMSGVFALGSRQPVGIDVELTRERGADPATVPPGTRVTILAPGGGRWRQTEGDGGQRGLPLAGIELDQPLLPRGGITWESAAPAAARIMTFGHEPGWMKQTGPARAVDRLAGSAVAAQLKADGPAIPVLQMLAASRRVEERMAAAATLALMGEFDAVVESLCEDSQAGRLREREWTELEAMTVPLALARGANAAAALRQSFVRSGLPGRDAELFLLARGLSADEIGAGGAAGLVASLEDPALVVRRYALANLLALVTNPSEVTAEYRPDRAMLLNGKGLAWWRARLAAGQLGGDGRAAEGP